MIQRIAGLFMLSMMVAASTNATIIPLSNTNFENPVLVSPGNTSGPNIVPSWTVTNTSGSPTIEHVSPSAAFPLGAVSPNNALRLQGGGEVRQEVSFSITPNNLYSLSLYVGNPSGTTPSAGIFLIDILVNGNPVASATINGLGEFGAPDGQFQLYTTSFIAGVNGPSSSTTIGVRLAVNSVPFTAFNGPVYFDNIELREILPEPGTWALMAVASVFGTGYLVKRRRRSLAA
jgi:hypothetical protein